MSWGIVMNPASSAHKILLGTGLGALMASGLALISGQLSVEEPSLGFLIPITGIFLILLSIQTKNGDGLLSSLVPVENDDNAKLRVEQELSSASKEEMIGGAWAKLEHTMLSKELEGEE